MKKPIRSALALSLGVLIMAGSVPGTALAGRQANGVLAGKATDEAKKPYSNYTVQVRDVMTGQVVTSVPLDTQGRFTVNGLALSSRYLVELFNVKQNNIVCTEGPYVLASPQNLAKTDINISCGTNPAVWWLAAAGAGAAALIAVAAASPSK